MENKKPLISVVTIVYNDVNHIEETIKSVINQTYKDIEYIIIDGGSTDGSLEIIKKYKKHIDYWVSERDKGIYDAMNKGIKKATGEYINFLNSGDYFYNKKVIFNIARIVNKVKFDLIYGKAKIIYKGYTSISPSTINKIKYGYMPNHQSTFVKKNVLNELGNFDLKYRSSSDFDFYCKFYKKKYNYLQLNAFIANFKAGGLSSNKDINYFETYPIIKKYFGKYYAYRFYLSKIILEQGTKKLLKKLRLKKLLAKLIKINNKRQIK